jgi:hypothetical protein
MEIIALLGAVMGVGFISGINLYATILALGLAIRFDFFTPPEYLQELEVLAHPYVLVPAGIAFIAEFFADKVPWVGLILLCGGVAFLSHSTKAGTRLVANHSPEPFTNSALSLAEDAVAITGAWLIFSHPVILFCIVLIFVLAALWILPKLYRLVRRQIGRVCGVFRNASRRVRGQAPLSEQP